MKLSFVLTAALALAATSAFAQTTAPSQPNQVGTETSGTPKYSTTQPTPMNSSTDHMGDMNGVQTSSTMTKRQMSHRNKGMMHNGRKTKMKADGTTKTTM